ncbi:hypothetical protein DMENIID0001_148110 [Sergentomyia squamirostris]
MPGDGVRPGVCASCKSNINQRTRPGVQCFGPCANWFHGECVNISPDDVKAFKSGDLDWMCWLCLPPDLVRSQDSLDNAEITVDAPADVARKIRFLEGEITRIREDYRAISRRNAYLENEIKALQFRVVACETNLPIWPMDASGTGFSRNLPNLRRASIGGRSWRWHPAPAPAPPTIVEDAGESGLAARTSGATDTTNATIVGGPDPDVVEGAAATGFSAAGDGGDGGDGAELVVDSEGNDGGGAHPDSPITAPNNVSKTADIAFRNLVSSTPSGGRRSGFGRNLSGLQSLLNPSFGPGRVSGGVGIDHPPGVIFTRSSGAAVSRLGEADERMVSSEQRQRLNTATPSGGGNNAQPTTNVVNSNANRMREDARRRERRERRRKENRTRPLTIGANSDVPLRAAPLAGGIAVLSAGLKQIFVTGLAPDTRDEELQSYLTSLGFPTTHNFHLVRVESSNNRRAGRMYASFRFIVPADRLEFIINPDLWPPLVRVKEWLFRSTTVPARLDDGGQRQSNP